MEKEIKDIIDTIEKSIADFQKQIPGIQQAVFDDLQNQLTRLKTKNGSILSSAENLRLIGEIQNKIERIILTNDYAKASQDFLSSFSQVEALQNTLFAGFNTKFKPKKTLGIIRDLAVESTANSLLDQGLQANVVDKISDLLRQNITAGGTVAQLSNQLRDFILTNDTGQGNLERYTTQITTDALNQYSAQYNDAVAQDMGGFSWGRYTGSNLTTTREFCEYLTKKQWVHKDELPQVIKGHIDGHTCKLNKKTELPLGMIAGTNENNFNIYRGGYNCGHQFFWVPDAAVPENVKAKINLEKSTKKVTEKVTENFDSNKKVTKFVEQKQKEMSTTGTTFTEKQIANAKSRYNAFVKYKTLADFDVETIGYNTATQRMDSHNKIVSEILNGNKELEKEWKMFFLKDEAKADRKLAESKSKLAANKEASADILAPIKAAKKLGEFGKWLNTSGNPFRKEFFSKKYTQESVNAFLKTL